MRILMLVPRPSIQGPIPKITPLLVSALESLGCLVSTEPWGQLRAGESIVQKVVGRVSDIAQVCRTLACGEFDLMVVTTTHDWMALSRDIPLLVFTRRHCRRIVVQFHGSRSAELVTPGHRLLKVATGVLLHLADAVLLLSREEGQNWQQFYTEGKFYVVSNPFVPVQIPEPAADDPDWTRVTGRPTLLFAGRLIAAKGVFDLLNAMPRILQHADCRLLIAGDGPEAAKVHAQVTKLGIGNHVTVTGYLIGRQLATAYRTAQIFVLPTFFGEGFPTVIAEAMGAGLPVVTTRIRGAADHLEEGTNALFVTPHDPEGLAETLIRLLNDVPLRQSMAQANQEKVKEFAPDRVGRAYLQVLETVVQSDRMNMVR